VNARFLSETAPPTLPASVAATAQAIEQAAHAQDWDALAALAMAEPTPFTAAFGQDFATPAELAAHWRRVATREPLDEIIVALVRLPSWYVTPASDGRGGEQPIHVTPRFMHEPTRVNRTSLEQAIGRERVAASIADGQYLGWRIGITTDGDWRFLVSGD
jgi:hypothetical protein